MHEGSGTGDSRLQEVRATTLEMSLRAALDGHVAAVTRSARKVRPCSQGVVRRLAFRLRETRDEPSPRYLALSCSANWWGCAMELDPWREKQVGRVLVTVDHLGWPRNQRLLGWFGLVAVAAATTTGLFFALRAAADRGIATH